MHPKRDSTRAPLAELPWLALTMVAQAIRLGRASNGYAAHAWRAEPIALSRLLSAALRHVAAFLRGEDTDQKTGAHHLACASFNLLAALELHQTDAVQVDDRWKPSREPDLAGVTAESVRAALTPPPSIEGASAGFAYNLSPTEMEGVRALRVWVEQTTGRRRKDPPEFAEIHAGGARTLGIVAECESDIWIATFPGNTDAKREALQALGLLGKQWSSWLSSDDAKGAAMHELNAALDKRREAVAADLTGERQ